MCVRVYYKLESLNIGKDLNYSFKIYTIFYENLYKILSSYIGTYKYPTNLNLEKIEKEYTCTWTYENFKITLEIKGLKLKHNSDSLT